MLWETSYLIWGTEWCDWCATTQWRWRTSRTRGHEIAHFDADDHPAAQVVRQQGDYVGSCPSARSAQHPGGFPVQSRPDTDHGVDDGHGESTTHVCQVGRTTDRYVCDIRQQMTQVRIAISEPQGGVDRCHVHALGQGEGPLVRLPAIQDGPASSAEDRSITRSAGDTDRSTATGSIMVPRADGPSPRRPGSPVHGGSRPADTRCVHGRGRDQDSSLPAVKSSRVETLRAILRAKGHSREAANMMSRCLWESSQQVYESHWSRFVAFCRTKRWHIFRVRSHHFSTLYDAPLKGRITTFDNYFTSHVCGFCARLLGVRSGSRPAYQATGQGFPAGKSAATQNHAQVGSSSGFIVINETAIYISKWGRWGILRWCNSSKMADAQMCVPVSIGFGETALVPARIEYSTWQMCVRERKHSTSTCGISTSGTWLPGEESATDAGPWMDHGTWDCSFESVGTGANVLSRSTAEALYPGLRKNPGGGGGGGGGRQRMFIHWNRSIRDIMRSHISRWIVETVKEAYTQADRQYDRVTAHEVRALSASWAYNCQVALPDILSAAFWRSSGVFQNSYLRDLAYIAEGISTLGPVVVAQQVVDPGHLHPPP